jgi:protein SCO1/2
MKIIRYITILAIAVLLAFQLYTRYSHQQSEEGDVQIGGHFTLINQDGKKISDAEFNGKLKLVYFGFTNCPAICPAGMALITQAMDGLGEKAKNVQPFFITIDPERDTAEKMKDYVSNFHKSIQGLTGTKTEIDEVVKAYRVFSKKVGEEKSGDYMMDHSSYIYLMDKDGKYLTHFGNEQSADELVQGIGKYLALRSIHLSG